MSHGEGARAAASQGPGEGTARLTSLFAPPCAVERQNHARELVQGLNLGEWDGIVTVSGDGLLYEVLREPWVLGSCRAGELPGAPQTSRLFLTQVLNGLLDRPDWEEAVKTPVGILPCGSGNALAGAVNQRGG